MAADGAIPVDGAGTVGDGAADAVTQSYQRLELVRLATSGSVDDGKSTLIGRLLYDCNAIYEDQLRAVQRVSGQKGMAELDFSLFTDGLAAEREQQITIDVAYRYFSTPRRRFIVADVPGHVQYTRNMVTGASTADIALILIDARKGVVTQSKRHLFIASLLGIPHILVVVNKMDEVGYDEAVFERIKSVIVEFAERLKIADLQLMPVSALRGDLVVSRGDRMNWYQGRTLFDYLDNLQIIGDRNLIDFRFPVQLVLRPNQDFRGFAGRVESGIVRVGDEIAVLPSGKSSRVRSLNVAGNECQEAAAGQSAVMTLADEIDVSRGNTIVRRNNLPEFANHFEATLCWFSSEPLQAGKTYILKQATTVTRCLVEELRYGIDIDTLHRAPRESLALNEIGRAYVRTNSPLSFDPYYKNRNTGSFILIDELTHETAAAGMIVEKRHRLFSIHDAGRVVATRGTVLWFTGLPGSGKTTIASKVGEVLGKRGVAVEHLDGDEFRKTIGRDLGFTRDDRNRNIERAANVAALLVKHGILVLGTFVSPYREQREMVKRIVPGAIEIFVNAPLDVCIERDPKGMYKEAKAGTRAQFTGIQQDYEIPERPDLALETDRLGVDECVEAVIRHLYNEGILF